MIQFLEHQNIDKEKWNACIRQSSNSILFVYSWYLDVVSPGWCALVLDDYKAVFPLPVKSKYGIQYVHQPFFTRYFGLFFPKNFSDDLLNQFINHIPEKIRYIEYSLHESNYIQRSDYTVTEKKFQQLGLSSSYEKLKKNYSENTVRNIKKAMRSNFSVDINCRFEEITDLFRSTKGKELKIYKSNDYKMLKILMDACAKNNAGQSLAVYNERKKLTAAAFFMGNSERYIFLKSGVTEEGRKNGAMQYLFDYFIQKNSGENSILDFGGSSVETVARFYKSFGAEEVVYLQIKKNKLPAPVRWIKK